MLKYFQKIIKTKPTTAALYFVMFLLALCGLTGFFDKALAIGILVLLFLTVATCFVIFKAGIKDQKIYFVFLIGLILHLGMVLFIYYGHFRPFGGGADFEEYNKIAIEIANRFSHGNFSLQGLYTEHFFPVLIGELYLFTFPSMIVGQLFTVWLAITSILLAYVIVIQIGGTKKTAFWASIIIAFYPSYLYFGSLLLKDTLVVPLALAGILLIVKMAQSFSWHKFLAFFIILTCLINLRFYIGYALMFTCIISWPLLSNFNFKDKMTHWILIVFLLGFSSQIVGNGYYGFNSFTKLLNPKSIAYYREVVYNAPPPISEPPAANPPAAQPIVYQPTPPKTAVPEPALPEPTAPAQNSFPKNPSQNNSNFIVETGLDSGAATPAQNSFPKNPSQNNSNFIVETGFDSGAATFLKNSFQSFIYSLLGPFPWQFTQKRQMLGLAETIPWYLLIVFSLYGAVEFIKEKGFLKFLKYHKFCLPLLLFGVFALGALSLFINNYGIIARIRIPVFICFILAMFISFNGDTEHLTGKKTT